MPASFQPRDPRPCPPGDLSPVPGSLDGGQPTDKGPFKRGQTNSPSGRNRNSEQRPEAQGPGRVTLPTARPQSLPLPASAQQPVSFESTAPGGAFEPTGHFVYAHVVLRVEMTQGCTLTRGPAYLETCPTWSHRKRGGLPDLVCLCFGKCTVPSLLPHASRPQFPQSQGPCLSPGTTITTMCVSPIRL